MIEDGWNIKNVMGLNVMERMENCWLLFES